MSITRYTVHDLDDELLESDYGQLVKYEDRAELVKEIEELRAAFNDRVRVIEMQLKDKEQLSQQLEQYRGVVEIVKNVAYCLEQRKLTELLELRESIDEALNKLGESDE